MRPISPEVLRQAVKDGVITAEQCEALLDRAAGARAGQGGAPEAPRGLNAVMVAYTVGAALVLFAAAWFVRDRWDDLGPGGVLVVAIALGLLFVTAARILRAAGFPTAAGWMTVLAVSMAPLVMWAFLRSVDTWPDPGSIYASEPTLHAWLWLTLELTTIAAALVGMRFMPFPHLALEIAVAMALSAPVLAIILYGAELGPRMSVWVLYVIGTGLLAIGYAAHRRGAERESSNWYFGVGLLCITIGYGGGWSHSGLRQALPAVALAAFATAIYLRRRLFLAFGMAAVIAWLTYLAFDVFRDLASFPVILATFGSLVILLTVGIQRRYPRLVAATEARMGDRQGTLPGDYFTACAPLAVALVLLLAMRSREEDRARQLAAELRRANHAVQVRRHQQGPTHQR